MNPTTGRATKDGVEILYRRFIQDDPKRLAMLEEARVSTAIGQAIYDLRVGAGLTQKQLAERVGTSHSVISRLEAADYDGHSLKMLGRICAALDHHLQLRFVPIPKGRGGKRATARKVTKK
jgi:ribosome-binding protein aMBF1 (putative translation factor)